MAGETSVATQRAAPVIGRKDWMLLEGQNLFPSDAGDNSEAEQLDAADREETQDWAAVRVASMGLARCKVTKAAMTVLKFLEASIKEATCQVSWCRRDDSLFSGSEWKLGMLIACC